MFECSWRFSGMPSLRCLEMDLSFNDVTATGVRSLAVVFEAPSLRAFHLHLKSLGAEPVPAQAAVAHAQAAVAHAHAMAQAQAQVAQLQALAQVLAHQQAQLQALALDQALFALQQKAWHHDVCLHIKT